MVDVGLFVVLACYQIGSASRSTHRASGEKEFRVHDAHLLTCFWPPMSFLFTRTICGESLWFKGSRVGGALAMALGCLLRSAAAESRSTQAYLSDDDDSLYWTWLLGI